MTSNQSGRTTEPTAADECRWSVKPPTGSWGPVDGAWWPSTADLATEFPPLITAMASLGMPVQRVSYHLDTWNRGERRLTVQGEVVRMEGFRTAQPHTVTMIGPDRTRTRLLVIPPATPADTARAVLRAAADTDSTATVEDLLEQNGVGASGAAAPPGWAADPVPEARWEADGGTPDRRAAVGGGAS